MVDLIGKDKYGLKLFVKKGRGIVTVDPIGKDKYGLKLFVERGWDGDVIITRDAWAEDRPKSLL